MCGRFIVIDKVEVVKKRFSIQEVLFDFQPNYNVGPGTYSAVITQDKPHQLQAFQFGMTPSWAKKPMYLFNARSEGDHNKDDDPGYTGGKGIIEKPSFRKPIRSQRCLVIASAFMEGPKDVGLSKPYLVYLRNKQRPFAFAGVWDTWKNPESGEELRSFAIVTTTANALLQKIGHHRMPVILHPNEERTWLRDSSSLSDITGILEPFPSDLMNAYPISPQIKNPRVNDLELLKPLGDTLLQETEIKVTKELEPKGFGHGKRSTE